jgi:hypothetical protein
LAIAGALGHSGDRWLYVFCRVCEGIRNSGCSAEHPRRNESCTADHHQCRKPAKQTHDSPVHFKVPGALAGIQDFQERAQQGIIHRFRIVVMAENGDIRTVEDRNIDVLTFTDEKDRREIQKALQRSYQAIRPDSDVTIVPTNGATKCAVQYVTTAPSPKTRYQLRQLGDKWELEAQAVVTNDSEEDWRASTWSM